ncbi:hypothetical protein AGMMS49525_04220 [Bacteroidia bacterium]|nr:hypothetical protein AGMMS49525_04220 [Bacteroidia bacterium]
MEYIGNISELKAGGDKPTVFSETKTKDCFVPIYSNGVVNEGLFGYTDKANYPKESITVSARGTIGYCELRNEPFDAIVRLIVVIPKQQYQTKYLFECIKRIEFDHSGSVQNQLTIPQISTLQIMLPSSDVLKRYNSIMYVLLEKKRILKTENSKLEEVKDLLLARMQRVEL